MFFSEVLIMHQYYLSAAENNVSANAGSSSVSVDRFFENLKRDALPKNVDMTQLDVSQKLIHEGLNAFQLVEAMMVEYLDSFVSDEMKKDPNFSLYQDLRISLRTLACDFLKGIEFCGTDSKKATDFYQDLIHKLLIPTLATTLNVSEAVAKSRLNEKMVSLNQTLPQSNTNSTVDFNAVFESSYPAGSTTRGSEPKYTIRELNTATKAITSAAIEEKTNRTEKNRTNRKAILDETRMLTREHINRNKLSSIDEKYLESLLKTAQDAIKEGDYVTAEVYLGIHRDGQRGVMTELRTHDDNQELLKSPVLIVDERAKKYDQPEKDTFENWAAMGLSYFQMAERLIEIESAKQIAVLEKELSSPDVDDARKNKIQVEIDAIKALQNTQTTELRSKASHFLTQIQKKSNEVLAKEKNPKKAYKKASEAARDYLANTVNYIVAPHLAEAKNAIGKNAKEKSESLTTEQALKELTEFKDFGILDQKPKVTVTLTYHKNYEGNTADAVFTDIKIQALTAKQRQWFEAIVANEGNEPSWFKAHKSIAQDVIRHYAPAILEGRALPTQFLEWIPGVLRNAKEIYGDLYERDVSDNLIYNTFSKRTNSGNIGHELNGEAAGKLTKTENDELIQEAVHQIEEVTGATKVSLNALTSTNSVRRAIFNAKGKKDEVALGEQLSSAVDGMDNVTTGVIGVNGWRRAEVIDMRAAIATYDAATQLIAYALSKANTEDDKRLIVWLQQVKEEFDSLRYGSGLIDPENKNLQLVATMEEMDSLMAQYFDNHQDDSELEKSTLFDFCKSSKDRYGMAGALEKGKSLMRALSRRLEGDELDKAFDASCEKSAAGPSFIQRFVRSTPVTLVRRVSAYITYIPVALALRIIPPLKSIFFAPVIPKTEKGSQQDSFDDVMKKTLPRMARAASDQTVGAEGLKDKEGITPDFMAEGEVADRLKRKTAKFNTELPKVTLKENDFLAQENAQAAQQTSSAGVMSALGVKASDNIMSQTKLIGENTEDSPQNTEDSRLVAPYQQLSGIPTDEEHDQVIKSHDGHRSPDSVSNGAESDDESAPLIRRNLF